jgi:hypothetical protein
MVMSLEWMLAFSQRTRIPEILVGAVFPGIDAAMRRRPRWVAFLAVLSGTVHFVHREWFAPWEGLGDGDVQELKRRFGDQPSRDDVLAFKHSRFPAVESRS